MSRHSRHGMIQRPFRMCDTPPPAILGVGAPMQPSCTASKIYQPAGSKAVAFHCSAELVQLRVAAAGVLFLQLLKVRHCAIAATQRLALNLRCRVPQWQRG